MKTVEADRRIIEDQRAVSRKAKAVFEGARDILVAEGRIQGDRKYLLDTMGTAETPVYVRLQHDPCNPFRSDPAKARRIDIIACTNVKRMLTIRRKGRIGSEAYHVTEWTGGTYIEEQLNGAYSTADHILDSLDPRLQHTLDGRRPEDVTKIEKYAEVVQSVRAKLEGMPPKAEPR